MLIGQKIGQFTLVERKGENMNVYLGRDEVTKREIIVKTLLINSPSQKKAMEAGIEIGMRISKGCIFLVRYEQVILKGDICYLIMEYCSAGDLAKIIENRIKDKKPFDDEEILRIVFQIGKAVEALHKENVIHRDLKPSNIFLSSHRVFKVGDYGISRIIEPTGKKTTLVIATIGYASPEILEGDSTLSKAMDVYSLGCILLEIIDLRHPFANVDNVISHKRIITGKVNEPPHKLSSIANALRAFAIRMVSENPAARPPIKELLDLPMVVEFLSIQYISSLCVSIESEKLAKERDDAVRERNDAVRERDQALKIASEKNSKQEFPVSMSSPSISAHFVVVPMAFLPNQIACCTITRSSEGLMCSFGSKGFRTLFLDRRISDGVYQWRVRIGRADCVYLGVAHPEVVRILGGGDWRSLKGTCSFSVYANSLDVRVATECDKITPIETRVENTSLITLEVDMRERTLSLFVENVKAPYVIEDIAGPLHFGAYVFLKDSFTSLSLRKLASTTPSPVFCKRYQFKRWY